MNTSADIPPEYIEAVVTLIFLIVGVLVGWASNSNIKHAIAEKRKNDEVDPRE